MNRPNVGTISPSCGIKDKRYAASRIANTHPSEWQDAWTPGRYREDYPGAWNVRGLSHRVSCIWTSENTLLCTSVHRSKNEIRAMMLRSLWEARNDAARSVHVRAVLLSEPIEHHPLLARHPQNVQGRKQHQTCPAGDPVLQQQSLRYAPKPLGGVHRVPDVPVYALRDEPVFLPKLERGRPV